MTLRVQLVPILIVVLLVLAAALYLSARVEPGQGSARATATVGGEPAPAFEGAARAAGADESWWQAASAGIARSEYHARANAVGLQAPNRAHNVRTYFDERGIAVVPREGEAEAAWRFAWATSRFGRPGALRAVAAAEPEASGSRVTYRRAEFDEWYENSPQGLEQGFTVHEAPPGEGPLTIAGRIAGGLRAELSADGGAVDLYDPHGARALHYAELHVWDARGEDVPARLSLDGAELAILVDDRAATYPLIVDPLLTTQAWGARGHQAGAYFGSSVATAGDVNGDGFSDVIVGAPGYDSGEVDEGKAFVYHGSGSGLATTPAWTAEGNQTGAAFGTAVATAGDVNGDGFSDVIIGADLFDNGEADEGRALVYHGSPAGLAPAPAWTAESNQASASLGRSVATLGDVNADGFSDVAVGAPLHDNGESNEGRVLAYQGSATGLAPAPAWTAESNQAGAFLGSSVAMAGDVNGDGFADGIVGANGYDGGQNGEGRALVYHGSATGLALTPAWTAEGNQDLANLGISVGTAGDVNGDGFADVIVGARDFDNGQIDEGRALVYHGSATGLGLAPAWTAESNQTGAWFGFSVGTAGDVNGDGFADVVVGAPIYSNQGSNEGRVFAYYGSAAGLAPTPGWTAESGDEDSRLGASVSTAGDVNGDGLSDVIVAAPLTDYDVIDEGLAGVFHGATGGLAASFAWTVESNQGSAQYGNSVASAGDVNGDGFADVIIGAPLYDNGEFDEGRAFVYHGGAAGLATTAAWITESNQSGARYGHAVAGAGDVNGDGFSDVLVGANLYGNGETGEGRVFAYHGAAAGLALTPAWSAESNQADAQLGISVAGAGDVNGDGFSDVIVGAHLFDNGTSDEGRVHVYQGAAAGLAQTPAWSAESNQAGAFFGIAVGTAGDVDGDGFSDVIIGAYSYDNGEGNEGRAFVYRGAAAGLGTSGAWIAESNQANASFGYAVGTAGDVNGDGYSDVVIGAFGYDGGASGDGRAFVYHGGAAGLGASPAWTDDGGQANARFGYAVGTAGDVNGDGYSDVIVGADLYDNGENDEGRAFVYHGSAAGLALIPVWTAESNQAGASFARSVATAGDVNGDGYADVLAGASGFDNGENGEGRAFLYYGNEGSGRRVQPRQQRTDGATPIVLLGRSDSETQFRIRAVMVSVFGRTRMQMESEVKPFGVPFDGTNTVLGTFTDIGNDGVINFNRLASGLTPGTPYHWRVRARYDLVRTPFQRQGPWVQVPVNGWNEADLRTAGGTIGIAEEGAPPRPRGLLEAPRPNPFGATGEIGYALPAAGRMRVAVYDVTGRERAVLAEGLADAGRRALRWDGRDARGARLPAGVYFVRLAFAGRVETQKLVLAP